MWPVRYNRLLYCLPQRSWLALAANAVWQSSGLVSVCKCDVKYFFILQVVNMIIGGKQSLWRAFPFEILWHKVQIFDVMENSSKIAWLKPLSIVCHASLIFFTHCSCHVPKQNFEHPTSHPDQALHCKFPCAFCPIALVQMPSIHRRTHLAWLSLSSILQLLLWNYSSRKDSHASPARRKRICTLGAIQGSRGIIIEHIVLTYTWESLQEVKKYYCYIYFLLQVHMILDMKNKGCSSRMRVQGVSHLKTLGKWKGASKRAFLETHM